MPLTENDLSGVYTGDVVSASGEKIGAVGQIYLDDQTGEPTFVTANTGLFGMSQSFVPLRGARVDDGNVVVDFDKTTVKDAPRIDDDGSLSPAEEDQIYAYYGMGTATADTADYGTVDRTPRPGYASADRDDSGTGDRRLAGRNDSVTGDLRTDRDDAVTLGPRTDRDDAGTGDPRSAERSGETDTVGPVGVAGADPMTPDAPPADGDQD